MVSWWYKSLAKNRQIGCVECLAGSGRPWSTHYAENNHEDRPHSHCSVRQIARKAHISHSSVRNVIKNNFQIELNFML